MSAWCPRCLPSRCNARGVGRFGSPGVIGRLTGLGSRGGRLGEVEWSRLGPGPSREALPTLVGGV